MIDLYTAPTTNGYKASCTLEELGLDDSVKLVDIRSGRSFNSGDTVTVKIAQVDLAKRQLELVVDDAEGRAVGRMKKALPKLPGTGGGIGGGGGAGFGDRNRKPGGQRRSQKSKARDKGKTQWRRDR